MNLESAVQPRMDTDEHGFPRAFTTACFSQQVSLANGSFIPNSETERGARPPRALFSAPSRKTPEAGNYAEARNPSWAEDAGREGAASNARGGRAPRTTECRFIRVRPCLSVAHFPQLLCLAVSKQSVVALLTQRRKGAKPQRGVSWRGSGHHLVIGHQVLIIPSCPCAFASSRLCVRTPFNCHGLG
jgi:hypothetical protein